MNNRKYVICMPIVRYNTIYQRTQRLMSELSKFATVLYLNPHYISSSSRLKIEPTRDNNVYDVTMPLSPYSTIVKPHNKKFPSQQYQEFATSDLLADEIENESEVMLFINASYWQPIATKVLTKLRNKKCKVVMIYDILDNFTYFKDLAPHKRLLTELHNLLMEEATLVTYTANAMLTSMMFTSIIAMDNTLYLPNACTPEDWEICKYHYAPQKGIIGYFGTMAHWFNTDTLRELVKCEDIKEVHLIGPISELTEKDLLISSKIKYLGIQNHQAISTLTWNWSCGLIPFRQTPLTDYTDPVKLYEYMSIGMPVVGSRLIELEHIRNNIVEWSNIITEDESCDEVPPDLCFRIARQNNPQEFIRMVLEVSNSNTPKKIAMRRKWASEQTWSHRITKLMSSIPLEWKHC